MASCTLARRYACRDSAASVSLRAPMSCEHGEVAGELARLVQHGAAADQDPLRGAGPVLEPHVVAVADALPALPHALCPLDQVLLQEELVQGASRHLVGV